jgi:peptidoglycan-N-acetylglucosamine deacetylase
MSLYWIKTNAIIKKIFSNYIWDIPNNENKIYLTFDDGPTAEITEWILEELQKHNAKATFFCIGKNIESHPSVFEKIINKNHSIGNHTYNHLNGWKTPNERYLKNISLCTESIEKHLKPEKKEGNYKLFRPPYGRIKPLQARKLRKQGYKIIMWDVLSADFDTSVTKEQCLENVISNIESGSIIVFHDSVKAFKNLKYSLPKVLDYLDQNNFQYSTL